MLAGMMARPRAAEILAVVAAFLRFVCRLLAPDVFAMRDIDHLVRDDPCARELELRNRPAFEPVQGCARGLKAFRQMRRADVPIVFGLDRAAFIRLDTAAGFDP
jgi:hypothetical protein